MPDERVTHPREGHSDKLSGLSDFEFRVWCQYRLSANDVGVMRFSAAPLMAGNSSLEKRGQTKIKNALVALVNCGLLVEFQHQGESFVCSERWQDFQNVKYPRETHLPIPSGSVLDKFSPATRKLFNTLILWMELRRKKRANEPGTVDELVPDPEPIISEPFGNEQPTVARAGARAEARNANANANANAPSVVVFSGDARAMVGELTPGQVRQAALDLIAGWNARVRPPFVRVADEPASLGRVIGALRAKPDLDWWFARFDEVMASGFCSGNGASGWLADFWWAIDHGDEIAAGRYGDRAQKPRVSPKTQATRDGLAEFLSRRVQ
jgi:hypothetical protein